MTERITQFQQLLAVLQARYPHCFPLDEVALLPLKIGIHHDLRQAGIDDQAAPLSRLVHQAFRVP